VAGREGDLEEMMDGADERGLQRRGLGRYQRSNENENENENEYH
jgi:hypothetical protein